jgi:hypothetical protein
MLAKKFPLGINKSLEFEIIDHNLPDDFILYWKVLNRGPESIRRNCIRGQITADAGGLNKSETANWPGNHLVECYAVINGVVVARDKILVPITEEE